MYRKYLFIIICLQKIYLSRDTISLNTVWPLFNFFLNFLYVRLFHCLLVQIRAYTDLKQCRKFQKFLSNSPNLCFVQMGAGHMRGHPTPGDPGGWRAGEALGPRGPPPLPGQTRQATPYFIPDKKINFFGPLSVQNFYLDIWFQRQNLRLSKEKRIGICVNFYLCQQT